MKQMTLLFFLLFSSLTFAEEVADFGIVVDTCNCPRIEQLSGDIQQVLAESYSQSKHSEVPVEFDQLTLVMEVQSAVERELSCSNVYSELTEDEISLQKSLEGAPIAEDLEKLFSFQSNKNQGEFNPSFLALASEFDRTLMFKGTINGEIKYFVIKVNQAGESVVGILDTPPKTVVDNEEIGIVAREEVHPTDNDFSPEEIVIENGNTGSFGQVMRDGGGRIIRASNGLGVSGEQAFVTNNGNVLQFGTKVEGTGTPNDGSVPPDQVVLNSVQFEQDVKYVNGLGSAVGDPADGEIELRGNIKHRVAPDGELLDTQTSVGASYRFSDYALDVDRRQNGMDSVPETEFRFGNLAANAGQVARVQSTLGINTPRLSFTEIPSASGGFNWGAAATGEDKEDPDDAFSFGVLTND
jgi:hypothetical protein